MRLDPAACPQRCATRARSGGLGACRFDDAGIRDFECLCQLQSLNLAYSHITNKGVHALCALTHLTFLSIDSRVITDAGLGALPRLSGLRALDAYGCKVRARDSLACMRCLLRLELAGFWRRTLRCYTGGCLSMQRAHDH